MDKLLPIIIVNWNGSEDTIRCIESILNSNIKLFHIYLVDNASSISEKRIIELKYNNHNHVTIIYNSQNIGFSKAHVNIWNSHLKDLETDYIALINNDTVLDPNALSEAYSCATEQNADMISFKMIQYHNQDKIDTIGHKILTSGEILPIGHNSPVEKYPNKITHVGPSAGACLYKVKCLNKIGFFDDFFDTGYEDAELGFRAFITGHDLVYCPTAIIYHKGGASIKKVFSTVYSIRVMRNIRYTVFKLYPLPLLLYHCLVDTIRSLLIIIFSIICLRWNYAIIIIKSLKDFFYTDLMAAIKARRIFYKNNSVINSIKIWSQQHSIFLYDLKRIYKFIIKRQPSAMDSYR